MKKSLRLFFAFNRFTILFPGFVLSLSVFGYFAWQTNFEPRFEAGGEYESSEYEREGGAGTENPMDDLDAALEYEFNMAKDPATGKIPEGIFEEERKQANEIARRRPSENAPEPVTYTFQGPDNLGGRTRAVAYDVRFDGTANQTILACGVSGGVYKSIDNGANWSRKSPTNDHFSCTSLAQDPRGGFQDTWYYTVGEAIGNSASGSGAFYLGNGVYKSVDNGETWTRLPNSNTSPLETFSTNTDLISRVVVNPVNGHVYIAAVAAIIRSTDGGATWEPVLFGAIANSSQLTDIAVTSSGRLYAAFSGTNSADADGVWTTTNGAVATWTRIASPGSPAGWNANGAYRRVVLAAAPSNQNIVYALYQNNFTSNCAGTIGPEAELFRWDNTTSSWTELSATLPDEAGCLNGNDPFATQGGYDLVVAVKPDDPATVFIGGTNIYRSTTSGTSWTRIGGYNSPAGFGLYAGSHPDIHAITFQPGSPSIMLCGNDGGVQRTTNNLAATVAWSQINNGYNTYQYYYAVNDPRPGNSKVIGGAQDNGTTRNIGGTGTSFESVIGADGVSVGLSDPAASGGVQYEYVGSQNGNIIRRDAASAPNFGTSIRPTTATTNGLFVTLFKLDPDNTQTLYYANAGTLYVTNSASTVTPATWTAMTGVATAVGANTITAIGLSRGPYSAATSSLFIGTSNGKVYRLDDPIGAPTAVPVNISGSNFPTGGNVSSISASPVDDSNLLVTFSNYNVSSVFLSNNANANANLAWGDIEGNLNLPSVRSSAIANLGTGGVQYFLGTSAGLFSSSSVPFSNTWTQEGTGQLGNAVVSSLDLRTSDNKLLVGTHGYGMWSANLGSSGTLPVLSINDISGNEGNTNGGTTAFNFTVNLSAPSSQTVTVNFATANGTAIAGSDYNALTGTVTFNPNETNKQVTIQVNGDLTFEPDETFFVNLSGPVNATISDGQGIATILNDDPIGDVSVSVTPASVPEDSQNGLVYTFTRTGSLATALTVNFSVGGTTTFGTDYAPNAGIFTGTTGTVTIGIGGQTGSIGIIPIADTINEPNETVVISVLPGIGYTAGNPSTATGTILNDDPPCTFTLNPQSQNFTSAAGSGSVQVSTQAGCQWTAVSNSLAETGSSTANLNTFDFSRMLGGAPPFAIFAIPDNTSANFINITSGGSGTGAGTINYSVAQNTLSSPRTGTMTIAGQTFTVNQAGSTNRQRISDFDGDGKSDLAVWRESNGIWFVNSSGTPVAPSQFGQLGDKIVPGDFDGDGKADLAVYRPAGGLWYLQQSTAGFSVTQWGAPTDVPVSGDFDGDGKADIAVWRPSTGVWFVRNSGNGQTVATQYGQDGDRLVPGEYDGDGKTDFAVWRQASGIWFIRKSGGGETAVQFGQPTDKAVPADYDGDGKTDLAVYREGNLSLWYIFPSTASAYTVTQWGTTDDVPVPGDYDGDGKADISVWRPSNGIWFMQRSTSGFLATQFGQIGDKPVPAAYLPVQ